MHSLDRGLTHCATASCHCTIIQILSFNVDLAVKLLAANFQSDAARPCSDFAPE